MKIKTVNKHELTFTDAEVMAALVHYAQRRGFDVTLHDKWTDAASLQPTGVAPRVWALTIDGGDMSA